MIKNIIWKFFNEPKVHWDAISGACFVVGNVTWKFFNEPKIHWVPLSVFLFLLTVCVRSDYVKKNTRKDAKGLYLWVTWLVILAAGNVVKQVFYSEKIKQINDYAFGGLVTIWLIINLIRWEIRKSQYGKN